ncbi:Prp24 [Kluyveromyces lactis]|nr:Prp24 [Kluyveromyces lactis]
MNAENNKRRPEDENVSVAAATLKKVKNIHTHNREYTTVLVKNLPPNYNHHKVRRYFKTCGSILQIDVTDSINGDSKLARIEFSSYDEALTAVSRTLKKIGFHQITVEQLKDSTIWVTNFPPGYDAGKLRNLLSQYIDSPILSIRLPSLAFNSRRRFAYVDLVSPEVAKNAENRLDGIKVNNYKLVAKISNVNERTERTDNAISDGREIIVKNLPDDITIDDLIKMFNGFGDTEKARIVTGDETGSGRHSKYAFITFKDKASADNALSLNGTVMNGKPLHVSKVMRKAYLERQEVKRLLASRKENPKVVGIYPLSDQITPDQILAFITEKAQIRPSDITKVLLVSDHEGALIIADKEAITAKVSLAISGYKFKNRILKCVSAHELSLHYPNEHKTTLNQPKHAVVKEIKSQHASQIDKKLSNDDFRKLFLSK